MLRNIAVTILFSLILVPKSLLAAEPPPPPPPPPVSPGLHNGVPKQVIAPTDVESIGRTISGASGYSRAVEIAVGEQIQIITDQGTAAFTVRTVKKTRDGVVNITVEDANEFDQNCAALTNVTVGSPVAIVVNEKIIAQTYIAGVNAIASGDYIVQAGSYRIVINVKQCNPQAQW